jgi:hypothetical protein
MEHLIQGVILKLKRLQEDTTDVKAATVLNELYNFMLFDLNNLIVALETAQQMQDNAKTPSAATDGV